MATLPLEQLFVVGFSGHDLPVEAQDLLRQGVGGAILFARNIASVAQVVDLNTQIFQCVGTERPALVAVDQEGGRVARLRGLATDLPPMRHIGRAQTIQPDLCFRLGAMMGRELVSLGFHWNFAPVLDVDTNPQNPVIGERSFATTPAEVITAAIPFMQGLQASGIGACGKHFPGHGDTDTDSHLDLPRLPHTLERLRSVELSPFAAAAQAKISSIMTAHVLFPALDPVYPATLSQPILQGLLRDELGYDGVVVSDDLEMKAVADRYSIEEMVERGLNAGVDVFLICHHLDKAAEAIACAHRLVDTGRVSVERAQQALACCCLEIPLHRCSRTTVAG